MSVVPETTLGDGLYRGTSRRHGVDTAGVRKIPGRLGIYFMSSGAGHRPLRDHLRPGQLRVRPWPGDDAIDWGTALEGAEWLYISGITSGTR